jgi:hypothetical protein
MRLFKILKKHGTPFQFGGTPDMGCRNRISQRASFFSPKILLSFVLDFTVILRHARNK